MNRIKIFFVFFFFSTSILVSASTIRVPLDQPNIQSGIYAAGDGDIVLVSDGTYMGNGNRDLDFLGKRIIVRSENGADFCIIDCQGSSSSIHRGFYFHRGEGPYSVLRGFTIKNGYHYHYGGGIFCHNSSPTIEFNTISNNQGKAGGGIYCLNSTAIIDHNNIVQNNGSGPYYNLQGGGISCEDASPLITNNTIADNVAGRQSTSDTTLGGGGICMILNSSPTIKNNIISGNTVINGDGGGIACYSSGSPFIAGNDIIDNAAVPYSLEVKGGGIACEYSSPTLLSNIIEGNSAGYFGGGIYCGLESHPLIVNNLIIGNEASHVVRDDGGGGIYCYGYGSSPIITYSVISGNTAEEYGGGIYCDYFASPRITNSILWQNSAANGQEIYIGNYYYISHLTISYSNVPAGAASVVVESGCTLNWGFGMINADPIFVTDPQGSYYLSQVASGQAQDSPCVNAGDPQSEGIGGTTRTDSIQDAGIMDMGYHYNLIAADASGPYTGDADEDITFDASRSYSSNGDITGYRWDFNRDAVWDTHWLNDPITPYRYEEKYHGWVRLEVRDTGNYTATCMTKMNLKTIYIDDDAIHDPGRGDTSVSDFEEDGSMVHPFDAIQQGIDAAHDGDKVRVLDGTYTGNGNRDLDFYGKAITVGSESGPGQCIIDCEGNETDPHRGFNFHSGEEEDSIVQGFTIQNGFISADRARGGGINCELSSPTINNNIITGNTVYSATENSLGGGIYCQYNHPEITNNIITNNSATGPGGIGGGVYFMCKQKYAFRYTSFTNNLISGNYAQMHTGGILCGSDSDNSMILDCCTIIDNSAGDYGGGLYVSYPGRWIFIKNSIIRGNTPVEIYYIQEAPSITYSDVMGGFSGDGNIDADPRFISGPTGDYYLFQSIEGGRSPASPCIDAGDPGSEMIYGTTRVDEYPDLGNIDMGYHYLTDRKYGPDPLLEEPTDLTLKFKNQE